MPFIKMSLPTKEVVECYADYLKSEYWQKLKSLYLSIYKISGLNCDCCGQALKYYSELHHISYENLGDMEKEFFDILAVCRDCHQKITEEEMKGLSPLDAISSARAIRLEQIRKCLEIGVAMHSQWKRLPCRFSDSSQQLEVDTMISEYRKAGLLGQYFKMV